MSEQKQLTTGLKSVCITFTDTSGNTLSVDFGPGDDLMGVKPTPGRKLDMETFTAVTRGIEPALHYLTNPQWSWVMQRVACCPVEEEEGKDNTDKG